MITFPFSMTNVTWLILFFSQNGFALCCDAALESAECCEQLAIKWNETAKMHEIFLKPKWCKMLMQLMAHLWMCIYTKHILKNAVDYVCKVYIIHLCTKYAMLFFLMETSFNDIFRKMRIYRHSVERECEKQNTRAKETDTEKCIILFRLNYEHSYD